MKGMRTRLYSLLFFFTTLLAACGGDDPVPEPPVEERSTVLVYMAADNSLSRFATDDLEELKQGWAQVDTSDKRLLVYIDKGSSPCLIELEKTKNEVVETIVKQYENRNSVGVDETQEVFDDVFNNPRYQAGSYGLVYWSHGDGWIPNPLPSSRWIGQDTGDGTHYMNIDDLATVLESAPHFDFIMFDACFMQSVEVAYELRRYCDYYIGFPAENPGPGAAYDKMLPYMFQKGGAVKMATATFKAYEEMYTGNMGSNSNWTMGTAISVLHTAKLEDLAAATAKALSGITETDREELRASVFSYDRRSEYSSSFVGYYDFVEMMENLVTDGPALSEWRRAYDAAMPYWATTPKIYSMLDGMFSMERANGMSHYIPSASSSASDKAAGAAYRSTAWYKAVGLSSLGW